MALDPDDPRPPYQQIANSLRASILTRKLPAGEKLPSGSELATRYGVARMTVQQALRILRDEGLIYSRQGSGVFVRERTERPVGLRPHLELAFDRPHVAVDFAGFSGETLSGALQEPLDKIRIGRLTPETVRIRMLLPDPSITWPLPCRVSDLADEPAFRSRAQRIMARWTDSLRDAVLELADLGLVKEADVQVRVAGCPPSFKVYLLNDEEAFFGFYPVRKHRVSIDGEQHQVFDLMGKDAVLFHHNVTDDDESTGTQYVQQARLWFDSMWSSVAHDLDG